MIRYKPSTQQGFTLLEVLVGFAIGAVALIILMQVFSDGLRLSSKIEDYSRATILAESLKAQVGAEYAIQDMPVSGIFDNRFNWFIEIIPYSDTQVPQSNNRKTSLVELSIQINWKDGRNDKNYGLSSLLIVPNKLR